MTKQTVVRLNAVVFVAFLVAGTAQAVPVVIDSWSLVTGAADYVGDNRFVNGVAETAVQLPFSRTTTRSYGQSICTNTYSFEVSEVGATFAFDFDHIRGGHGPTSKYPGAMAQSRGYVDFHVTVPVTYTVSGQYAMSGTNGLFLWAAVIGPAQVEVFSNSQGSYAVENESFVVGGLGGADYSYLVGSPSGSLQPGLAYSLVYDYGLTATAYDAGASALGSLELTLTPEPGSSALLAVAMGLVFGMGHGNKWLS